MIDTLVSHSNVVRLSQSKDQSLTDTGACKHTRHQARSGHAVRSPGPWLLAFRRLAVKLELFKGLTVKLQWASGSTAHANLHSLLPT